MSWIANTDGTTATDSQSGVTANITGSTTYTAGSIVSPSDLDAGSVAAAAAVSSVLSTGVSVGMTALGVRPAAPVASSSSSWSSLLLLGAAAAGGLYLWSRS
jgi:hypothetical protein